MSSCLQAAIYRLSGDTNPLHIDPRMARAGNFNRPILHGLCTLGYAVRHVLLACQVPVSRVSEVQARFSKPVFPGDTLITSAWKTGKQVLFQVKVVGRDDIALTNGQVTLLEHEVAMQTTANATNSELKVSRSTLIHS